MYNNQTENIEHLRQLQNIETTSESIITPNIGHALIENKEVGLRIVVVTPNTPSIPFSATIEDDCVRLDQKATSMIMPINEKAKDFQINNTMRVLNRRSIDSDENEPIEIDLSINANHSVNRNNIVRLFYIEIIPELASNAYSSSACLTPVVDNNELNKQIMLSSERATQITIPGDQQYKFIVDSDNNSKKITEITVINRSRNIVTANISYQNGNTIISTNTQQNVRFKFNTHEKSIKSISSTYGTGIAKQIFGQNMITLNNAKEQLGHIIGNDNIAYIAIFQTTIILLAILGALLHIIAKMLFSESRLTKYLQGITTGYINDNTNVYSKYAQSAISVIEEAAVIYFILPFFSKGLIHINFFNTLPLMSTIKLTSKEIVHFHIIKRPLTTGTIVCIIAVMIGSRIANMLNKQQRSKTSSILHTLFTVIFQFLIITWTTNITIGSKILYLIATQVYLITLAKAKFIKLI